MMGPLHPAQMNGVISVETRPGLMGCLYWQQSVPHNRQPLVLTTERSYTEWHSLSIYGRL